MLEIPSWVYEFRGRTKKIYKYKKRKKCEKIFEEFIEIVRNLANTEPTQNIEKSETENEHWKPLDLIYDIWSLTWSNIHIYILTFRRLKSQKQQFDN